jgi:hypothetical protein
MLAASVGWRTPWRTRRKIPAHEPFYSGLENRYPSLGGSRVRIPPLPVTKRFLGRGHLGTACDGSRNRNAQSVDVHGRLLKSTGFVRHRRSAGAPRRPCSFSALLLDRPAATPVVGSDDGSPFFADFDLLAQETRTYLASGHLARGGQHREPGCVARLTDRRDRCSRREVPARGARAGPASQEADARTRTGDPFITSFGLLSPPVTRSHLTRCAEAA